MRSRRLLLPVLALVVAATALAGCSSFRPYAATVNGKRISQGTLQRELDAILGNEKYLEQQDASFA